eukprot:5599962-Prymnesium_polylepis.1
MRRVVHRRHAERAPPLQLAHHDALVDAAQHLPLAQPRHLLLGRVARGAALAPRVPKDPKVAVLRGPVARALVPRAVVVARVEQAVEVAVGRRRRARELVPGALVRVA